MNQFPDRLLAIDIDGTLLSPKGEITPATRTALTRAVEAGMEIVFATGRNYHSESRRIITQADCSSHGVFITGAMVLETRQNIVLHRIGLDAMLARTLCKVFQDAGHAALVLQDAHTADVDYFYSDGLKLNPETQRWLSNTKARVQPHSQLTDHTHEHSMRISIVADAGELEKLNRLLDAQFGGSIVTHCIGIPGLTISLLEVFGPGVNKWNGITRIADQLSIDHAQIIAIGDDLNDLSMIRAAGLGVAMGNARLEVKTAARHVTDTNANDGLAKFINELLDGKHNSIRPTEVAA